MVLSCDNYRSECKCKLEIRKRDIEILSDLELWGLLNELQVNAVFHKEKTDMSVKISWLFGKIKQAVTNTARLRMRKLEAAGYIKIRRFPGQNKTYTLTASGHNLLKAEGRNALPAHQARISPACITHQLLTAAVGLTISKFWRSPVLSGRQILHELHKKIAQGLAHRNGNIIPDLIVNDPKYPRYVEVELNQKPNKVYSEIWHRYGEILPEEYVIVYLMATNDACRRIITLAERLGMEKLYTAAIDEFRARQGRVLMKGTDGREMYLIDF